jgi:hypothetical protein
MKKYILSWRKNTTKIFTNKIGSNQYKQLMVNKINNKMYKNIQV